MQSILLEFSIAAAAIVAEFAYGAWLLNLPAPQLKARGYEVIYGALESCVAGAILAAILVWAPTALRALGIGFVSPGAALESYAAARDRYVKYAVDLALVARDLTLTGVLAPLATTWYASSGLANLFTGYLAALSSALLVASRTCLVLGPSLMSLGIVLAGVSRLRRLGATLAISIACLEVVAGALAPYFAANAASLRFKYAGVPLSGIAQYFAGAVNDVLEDVKLMGEFSAWVSLAIGLAAAVSAGLSLALGGLPETLVSRLRA